MRRKALLDDNTIEVLRREAARLFEAWEKGDLDGIDVLRHAEGLLLEHGDPHEQGSENSDPLHPLVTVLDMLSGLHKDGHGHVEVVERAPDFQRRLADAPRLAVKDEHDRS